MECGCETTGAKTAPQLKHGVITTYLSFQIIKPWLRATEPFAYYQAGPGNFAEREKVKRKVSARSASLVA